MRRLKGKDGDEETSAGCVDAKFLAKKYNVSIRLIHLMAAKNRIPKITIGRCVRFDEAAVAKIFGG